MNETIGVKGGHNDRRKMMLRKNQRKKLEELEKEKDLKKMENKVRKEQIRNLIQFLPIAVIGQTVQTLSGRNKENKQEEKDSIVSFDVISNQNKEEKKFRGKVSSEVVSGGKSQNEGKIISNNFFSNRMNPSIKTRTIIKEASKKEIPTKEAPTKVVPQRTIIIPSSHIEPIFKGIDSSLDKSLSEKLKGRKIVDEYEKQLKDIRYELRKAIFEYNVLIAEEDQAIFSRDIDNLMEKLSEVIQKIEELKDKMKVEDLDKYDDNYIYTLIQDYLTEFKNSNVVSSIKDSSLYISISQKLDELDEKKESFEKKVEQKKEELSLKEKNFEELKEKYYQIDKVNKELLDFQKEQEQLLKEIQEKVANALTAQEKVEVQAHALNHELRRILRIMAISSLVPGRRAAKGLAASIASYLFFTKQLLHPKTTSRKYKVITVEDYTGNIEKSIQDINNANSMLYRTGIQVDRLIYEIKTDFHDYIDVVPECKDMLLQLEKVKSQIREKEYEMEKIKREQELQLEKNKAKLLKRGEYTI